VDVHAFDQELHDPGLLGREQLGPDRVDPLQGVGDLTFGDCLRLQGTQVVADDIEPVSALLVGEALPFYGGAQTRRELTFSPSEYEEFVETAVALRDDHKGKLAIHVYTEWGFLVNDRAGHAPCSALDRDMAILYDGYAYPCPFITALRHDIRDSNARNSAILPQQRYLGYRVE